MNNQECVGVKMKSNKMYPFLTIALFLLVLVPAKSDAAEIFIMDEEKIGITKIEPFSICTSGIYIRGAIRSGDAKVLNEKVSKIRNNIGNYVCPLGYPTVSLISKGGDVDEAMSIGRIIRKNRMGTLVGYNDSSESDRRAKCYSACVFILASGVKRQVIHELGVVGIHRPYFNRSEGSESVENTRLMRRKLTNEITQYFEEMDINPSLIQDMMASSPTEIRSLSAEETQRYRLSVDDANFEEVEVLKEAKKYGISTAEYRSRNRIAESHCEIRSVDHWKCRDAILLGISLSQYEQRIDRARRVCIGKGRDEINLCMERVLYRNLPN
jgi:hypothetical protein